MKGFFNKEQLKSAPYKSEKGILSCASCGLYKSAITPKMAPYGNFKKGIMIIGEGPCENDDEKGKPWQGQVGRILQRKCRQLGVDLFEDCISLHAVNCRPIDKSGNNRPPTDHEIACCRQKVIQIITKYKPKIIILQGGSAISSLVTGWKWKGNHQGISTWRGWAIPYREFGAWVCPTFHPLFVEKCDKDSEAGVIWENDLRNAFSKIDKPIEFKDEKDCVIITHDIWLVLSTIIKQEPPLLAFDIECTGLKPYNKGHKIISISFCWEKNKAWAIPMPVGAGNLALLKKVLENPNIGKIAANMKHEDNWLVTLHNINTTPWAFDTMQAAHILDNRPGVTGLKFQSFVNYGLVGYDDEISSYLKGETANSLNRISELLKDDDMFKKLLLYNGIDSLMTFRRAIDQRHKMKIKN